jgi:hypothetical protein
MNDYDAVLIRMILEAKNDPARMREVIYEAARLTLRRQINLHKPPLSSSESKRKLIALDDAIARVESGILSLDRSHFLERSNTAAVANIGHSPKEQDRPVSDERTQSINPVRQTAHDCSPTEEPAGFPRRAANGQDAPSRIEESRLAKHSNGLGLQLDWRHSLETQRWQPAAVSVPPRAVVVANGEYSSAPPNAPAPDSPHLGANTVRHTAHVSPATERPLRSSATAADQHDTPSRIERPRQGRSVVAKSSGDLILERGWPHTSETRPSGHATILSESPRATTVATGEDSSTLPDASPPDSSDFVRYDIPRGKQESRRGHLRPAEQSDDSIPRPRTSQTRASQLVLMPTRVQNAKPYTHRADLVPSDDSYRVPPASRVRMHLVVSALAVSQLAIAVIAIAAFLMSLWARNNVVQAGAEQAPALPQTSTASLATMLPAALPFPRPTVYGVYAINENQLVALEQIQGTPVDPRTRNQLKITQPSHTVISGTKVKFVVYRRGLASNAPDSVKVRVAAQIAHSMAFGSDGRPTITTPETTTWLIRNDNGYELRVSPLPDSAEMIELRPEDADFSYPAGRYELLLGEQAYDFVIAGEVLDPAHCVEGVATGRGPVFYECKLAQRPRPL